MAAQARRAGLPVTVVRPYSGYGEDQSTDFPFGAFVARAKRREDPFTIWGDGGQVRDWIHVDDLVAGALAVVDSGVEEPVSLCTGIGTSMFDLASMMIREVGGPETFLFDGDKPAGVSVRVGDPTRMLEFYTPQVTLAEGIKRALA
jgi:nucleoside-diphosphate-sugar epimerase